MKKFIITLLLFSFITFTNIFAVDVTQFTYDNVVLNTSADNNNSTISDVVFNNDGSKVYIAHDNEIVLQYSLSSNWDLSSASLDHSFNLSTQLSDLNSITFDNTGTKFYAVGDVQDTIYQYNVSTPYNLSTASYSGKSFNYSGTIGELETIQFNQNGTKLYGLGRNSDWFVFSLSTAYDITTLSYDGIREFFNGFSPLSFGGRFTEDGNYFIIADWINFEFDQFVMNTPFDVENATYVGSYDFSSDTNNRISGVTFSNDNVKFYGSVDSNREIIQYTTGFNPEPPTYTVDLTTSFNPYTDFIYNDDEISITTNSISTTILNDESWSITTNISDFSPFNFSYWYDITNQEIFNNNRTFSIGDPFRNYNLTAVYTLTPEDTTYLNFDSNLPTPPNFNMTTSSIEGRTVNINKYPFNNHEHPKGFYYEIGAPINNVGFYEFDYWFDNVNEEIYSVSNVITSSGINDLDLTAIYSLPDEYQINLTLFSNIGNITFQLGNQDPITGSSISVTIGEGDAWTAIGPLNEDYSFNNWFDITENTTFINTRSFTISNTTRDYRLQAQYDRIWDVNFDSDGGTLLPSISVIQGNSIDKPENPIRPQFVFDGWYKSGDPNQTKITFPYFPTEDTTLVAIWLDTYTLTYDTNGGGRIEEDIYIEETIPEVVTPSRFGYTFEGWFTDDGTFQNEYEFTDPITQDTTIHAKWAFGSDRDAELSLTTFLNDNDLGDPFSRIIVMITIYVFVNIVIMIYQAPLIVTLILNFIVTSLFMILGWIAIWLVVVIFMALFGFLYFTSSGRGLTE